MQFTRFEVENYKGIQKLHFDLQKSPFSPIYTLVGLNESGKTTVLEAVAFFFDNWNSEKEVGIHSLAVNDMHSLIPKSKRDNFNGTVKLSGKLVFSEDDKKEITEFLNKKGYKKYIIDDDGVFTLSFEFKDSVYLENGKKSTAPFIARVAKTSTAKTLTWLHDVKKEDWLELLSFIKAKVQPIIYYPNFLFDFPAKIYLSSDPTPASPQNSREQKFYRMFIQDILDSLENDLQIQTHIIDRKNSGKSRDMDALETLKIKIGAKLSNIVFQNELNIFKDSKTELIISIESDGTPTTVFLSIRVKQGTEIYEIRERSLGFRWFIIFNLLTQFRLSRKGATPPLFIFDEPASNLHQTAQKKLLKAFDTLTSRSNVSIIYSTHSHHLINPEWLENTFIVSNKAHDPNDDEDFIATNTDIEIKRYRQFVAESPNQITYYQPILDVLEYSPSNLEFIPDVVMVEGKNDYYTIRQIIKELDYKKPFHVLPGCGSGALDTPIRLYLGWGKNFLILLDGDGAGEREKNRYSKNLGKVIDGRIRCLGDIEPSWQGMALESLFESSDLLAIQKIAFPDVAIYSKDIFNRAIQELLARNVKFGKLSKTTKTNFTKLFNALATALTSK